MAEAEPWARYAWVAADDPDDETAWVPEAFCLLVTRADPARVVAAFGADPAPAHPAGTWDDAGELIGAEPFDEDAYEMERNLVRLTRIGDWTVAVEDNGWVGVQDEVIRALSADGRCAAFYRSVNADMRVALGEGGEVVRAFDPLLYMDDVGDPLPEEADLPFDEDDAEADALALLVMERWTGLALERDPLFEGPGALHWYPTP